MFNSPAVKQQHNTTGIFSMAQLSPRNVPPVCIADCHHCSLPDLIVLKKKAISNCSALINHYLIDFDRIVITETHRSARLSLSDFQVKFHQNHHQKFSQVHS